MEKKTVLILAGASAAGKTTVAYEIIRRHPHFELSRSATTRAPRGDGNDNEYIYFSSEEFRAAIASGDMLEHTEFAGNCYGTTKREIKRIFDEGKIPLLILDVVGVHSLMEKKDLSVCGVYVYDDIKVMQGRIFERYLGNGEDPDGRRRYESRKRQNEEDYRNLPNIIDDFYALVKNEDTPEEGAKRVAAAFGRFEERIPKDAGENLRLAKEIQKTVV
jgi:guanylate kinase